MKKNLLNNIDIKALSLFVDVSEGIIEKILQDSHIVNLQKGEQLFLNSEKVNNFYVLLQGSLKLSVSNVEGEEIIIQIVNSGQFVADLFSDKFLSDAYALKDSIVLSLPIKNLSQYLAENSLLMKNFLTESALRNRSLFNRITHLKLDNAKQRVANFLLHSAFEGGKKKAEFLLDLDKNVIATYLGLRPETLSRVLKQLSDDGEIFLESKKIKLIRKDSLCSYCDEEIVGKCADVNSEFCKKDHL